MMGRLKPGVTLEKARQEVSAIEANAIREHVSGRPLSQFEDGLKETPIHVVSGARGFSERRAEYGKALWVLMAAVGLVILVVCANVSSLMLARTVARGREMTVRMTLGAGRGRLIQQMLVEGTLLAIVSSVLGLFAATWGTRVLLATVSASSPIAIDTTPDARVLAFTATMTLACVLLFGLLPAFRATRVDLATSLRSQGRNLMGAARVGRIPFGRALVVAQIALSMLLLIGGGLLVRSMQQLLHSDIGVDRDHVVAVRVRTARSPYVGARLAQFRRDLADRVGRLPGVDAVAFADHGLFSGGASGWSRRCVGFRSASGFGARGFTRSRRPELFPCDRRALDSRPRHRAARSRDRAARHGDQRDDGEAVFRCSRSTRRYGDGRQRPVHHRRGRAGFSKQRRPRQTASRDVRRVQRSEHGRRGASQTLRCTFAGIRRALWNQFVVRSKTSIGRCRSSSIR